MDKKNYTTQGEFRESSKQKRKNARIRVNLNGTFVILGMDKENECNIVDIGTGGMGILTKTLLYPGDKVKIHFWLDDKEFYLQGTVSRVSGKNVGLIFEDISTDDIAKIQNYIHSRLFK